MMPGRVFVAIFILLFSATLSFAAVLPVLNLISGADQPGLSAPKSGLIQLAAARKYFVILGSFRKRGQAQRRCSMFGDGYVVSTNDYPNFRNGYWACVIGPLSRADADDQMWASREAVGDAYVKAGW